MAHAYTPGLRVTARSRVTRDRRLPLQGQVLVGTGQAVEAATVVATTDLPGPVATLHVANLLGIDATDLPVAMLVKEGGAVEKDQVIARGGGFLGMFKGQVPSPLAGTVESVSKVTGQVLLRGKPVPISVEAYVRGQVSAVLPQEGVTVASEVALIQGIFGIGGETRGKIYLVAASPDEPLEPGRLAGVPAGSVVIGGSHASLEAIRAAIAAKVCALVVGGVRYATFTELLGKPIGVAVTGSERIGITLIVTEGFGRIPMAQRTFELLRANEGREASANGATQIRAGVIRPEILIPLDSGIGEAPGDPEPRGVEEGSSVRIIREPWFGRLGTVVALPPELKSLESETRVRIAEVRLGDGQTVAVPRSNLERIED